MSNLAIGLAVGTAIGTSSRMSSSNNKYSACKEIEKTFNPDTATVSQKKEYSQCIEYSYQNSLNKDLIIANTIFTLLIATVLVWMIIKRKLTRQAMIISTVSFILYSIVSSVFIFK